MDTVAFLSTLATLFEGPKPGQCLVLPREQSAYLAHQCREHAQDLVMRDYFGEIKTSAGTESVQIGQTNEQELIPATEVDLSNLDNISPSS